MRYVPKELRETRDVSRGGRTDLRETMGRLGRLGVVLVVLYVLLGVLADQVALRIPERWEARLDLSGEATDDPVMERPERLLARLVESGELRPLPYRLRLLETQSPNAVALPGGTIGVTRGLLEEIGGDPGLAMVLGHELGHHDARHTIRRLGRVLLLWLPLASVTGEAAGLLGNALGLAELKYSRDQEREADRIGLTLVHRAFGSTQGALEFFELVEREHASGGGRWAALAASHPPTRERLETLRAQARVLETSGF